MIKHICFYTTVLCLFVFSVSNTLLACDTTPSLTIDNVLANEDGTYYMDITACIGSEGSADGFDLYFNNDIDILATTVTEISASGTGNTATVSVEDGVWEAYFDEYNPATNSPYFENSGWGLDCIEFGIITDENPEGATLYSLGMNEDCFWFSTDGFITSGIIPGPCLPNYFINDNGTIDSDVIPAGQNCNFAPFNDEILEFTVTCAANFNFSLTQDASINWPGESWLTLAAGCCSGVIEQTSSFGFMEPVLTIDTYLDEGTYYVIVDIEGNGFPGDYILDITSDATLSSITTADAGEDQFIIQENTILNGNPVNMDETGTWSVISGSGVFEDPSDPNTIVTNLSNGTNIFQWEIENSCTNSNDNIIVEVAQVSINLPNVVYCLDEIPLEAIGTGGQPGTWSVTPDFNITIDEVNSPSTFATATAYGTYTFSYTCCGTVFSEDVTIESITPIVSSMSYNYYCLESFELSATVDGDPGYWESNGPFIATFDDPTSLNPTVTVGGYGTYQFTYYGCGTSNTIAIDMISSNPIASGPEEIYCVLEPFEISATVNGDPGFWSAEGPGNIVFDDQGALNTSVNVDGYGTYFFTYNGCGASSDPIEIDILAIPPVIMEPDENTTIYCDLEIPLGAQLLGDPGYWGYTGPGNAVFSDPGSGIFNNLDLQTTLVNVDQYGIYEFIYYGCGTESEPIVIDFQTLTPNIVVEDNIYCNLSTNLTALTQGSASNSATWSINQTPNGETANFTSPNLLDTEMVVSGYGTYEVQLDWCGSTTFTEINFLPQPPHIIAPNFQDCILTATLIAYTDDPSGGGPWQQISGENGAIFSTPNSNITEVIVPSFGVYSFSYAGCDAVTEIEIAFECPLIFPNVITPNDDGNNEFFIIQNLNPEIYTESILTIYNRWGVVIFTAIGYGLNEEWWNGKVTYKNQPVNDGVYYYVLEVFNNAKMQKEEYSGEINIFKSNSSSSNQE